MNILLICQCDKRALTETRRILDQFAERRGDRTWQTPITQAGLDTLRKLLRKTARKNTAVACHWIRGRDHSELLWIVGDAKRFNNEGAVPTNTTTRNILRRESENDWHTGEDIYLLSALAALMHDLGKACEIFQERLKPGAVIDRNLYRHEWISLRLFQAFIGTDQTDEQWLSRLMQPAAADDASWLRQLQRDGIDIEVDNPFSAMPPLAKAIGWLILTHHRLPVMPSLDAHGRPQYLGTRVGDFRSDSLRDVLTKIDAGWNEQCTETRHPLIEPYWHFPEGLPVTTPLWRKRAARLATRLQILIKKPSPTAWTNNPYIMHLSRLSLMLADHHYSSLTEKSDRVTGEKNYPLYANTDRKTGGYNQTLDEHLLGVEAHAGLVTRALPHFEKHLPRLARHKGLRKRSADERFRWQDRAADTATVMRERASRQGAFIVNMASTGCGKTLANARIMNALADPATGMRCAFALGLRTLTLQTGHAFRDTLNLSDDELAIQVGGGATRELFEYHERKAERSGSSSTQDLLSEDSHVLFEGNDNDPLLQRLTRDPHVRTLLAAPLLVCTIDHLTPATESQRGGRQIAPMLRLMSSDLVLDEPDDFDLADLPALTRLVHWAGLLGTRVLLSSATLPPALVQGLFQAYLDGRTWYQRNRGERPGEAPNVCCAWFDEFNQAQSDCSSAKAFATTQLVFAQQRHLRLGKEAVRRHSELLPLSFSSHDSKIIRREFAQTIRDAALRLHAQHQSVDPHSGKRVSFGLMRMANIDPLFDVALALYTLGAPEGFRIHLCTYHSQFPLLIRSSIEQRLDQALNRRQSEAVFDLRDIRERLDASPEEDQIFVVLGSPVTEVGRDHDYDWAIVEPSSMRSLIQLAGRIRRHRQAPCTSANLLVCSSNLRHFEHPGEPAFCKPGFEGSENEPEFQLTTHLLDSLLRENERTVIDARPRIVPRPDDQLQPKQRLVDLEHVRLARQMLPQIPSGPPLTERQLRAGAKAPIPAINASSHWTLPQAWLTAVLSQQQPFRYDAIPRVDLVLLPNDDEDDYALTRIDPGQRKWESIHVAIDVNQNHRVPNEQVRGERIEAWGEVDYLQALITLAESMDIPLRRCAERYGTVTLPDSINGWRFHPALGFTKQK